MRLSILLLFLMPIFALGGDEPSNEDILKAYRDSLPPIERDLLDAVRAIAKKHGVDESEIIKVAKKAILDSPPILFAHGKGGVSPLGDDRYVVNDSDKNKVITKDGEWTGKTKSTPELLCIINQKIFPISTVDAKSSILFVLFQNDKIRYLDWNDLSGGYVLRNNEKMKATKTSLLTPDPP